MFHAAERDEAVFEAAVDQASLASGPSEDLPGLAGELFGGVGEGAVRLAGGFAVSVCFCPSASRRELTAKARRARAWASSEETFGCAERIRRWFFA